MLGSMADRQPESVWSDLSDNQCATFFQVTYVLAKCGIGNVGTLAGCVDKLLRVGGSEMKCPSPGNPDRQRTVKGWRLHVEFDRDRDDMEILLRSIGFDRDSGRVVRTHTDCGYKTSFRARGQG